MHVLRLIVAGLLAAGLAGHGLRKRSLSFSGAAAACLVGFVHMHSSLRTGALLILFYYTSSQLTKYKAAVKAQIEHEHKEGGQRNVVQVLANSLGGCLLCLALPSTSGPQLRRRLTSAFLAHYAAACSDTWSSELGVLSHQPPRMILTGKVVPKGTNGGVSLLGLAAGVAGGTFMGLCFWITGSVDRYWGLDPISFGGCLCVGTLFGLIGTVLDSVIGAALQNSTQLPEGQMSSRPAAGGQHVSGWDLLSNDAVNFVTVNATALLAGLLWPL